MEFILIACILGYGIGSVIGPLMEAFQYWSEAPERRARRAEEKALRAEVAPILDRLRSEIPTAQVTFTEFKALIMAGEVFWAKDPDADVGYRRYCQGIELQIAA